jgi:hypothetical protein
VLNFSISFHLGFLREEAAAPKLLIKFIHVQAILIFINHYILHV